MADDTLTQAITTAMKTVAHSQALSLCAIGLMIAVTAARADTLESVRIHSVSAQPDRVSGGDALVKISFASAADHERMRVFLNRRDISASFHSDQRGAEYLGLVTGLDIGVNALHVELNGRRRASLKLINYPAQGPIVSGPHIEPFVCRTSDFKLVDGSLFGPPLDADCTASARVVYLYMSTLTNKLTVLGNIRELPSDVAKTTLSNGQTVNFVVRVETATVNRGIYESAILHDPVTQASPSPFQPLRGWNRVLLGIHGVGCPGGWYTQGGTARDFRRALLLDVKKLSQGYALYTNTLQNSSDSCNTFLAGETAMMGKERFIENYGVPDYSVTMGVSGGAYTSLAIIDAFPGVFNGAYIGQSFPDALSIAVSAMDAHLLRHYFSTTNQGGFTEAQQLAVSGYSSLQAWFDAANQAGRTDPVPGRVDAHNYVSAIWSSAVPAELRYDPRNNPTGARPTIWDVARNIYGIDPNTGFALRAYDNVGIQYGLAAFNAGIISKSQFLNLNERIGGFDRDGNYTATRTRGDEKAIVEAYRSGLNLGAGGGLADVPILDFSGPIRENADHHYQWYHFAIRDRLTAANGDSSNFILWRGDMTETEAVQDKGFEAINQWIAAIKADSSRIPLHGKVAANKPQSLLDGCWDKSGEFIAEQQHFAREPDTPCNRLWPSYGFPRLIAGGPLAANILKCDLKRIDRRDYTAAFEASEQHRLRLVFPEGVCEWSGKGRFFHRTVVGRSYGPARSGRSGRE